MTPPPSEAYAILYAGLAFSAVCGALALVGKIILRIMERRK